MDACGRSESVFGQRVACVMNEKQTQLKPVTLPTKKVRLNGTNQNIYTDNRTQNYMKIKTTAAWCDHAKHNRLCFKINRDICF